MEAGSGEQGAENGDHCSTVKVEAPGLCPQLALAGATPREAGASSLTRSVQRGVNYSTSLGTSGLLPWSRSTLYLPESAMSPAVSSGLVFLNSSVLAR